MYSHILFDLDGTLSDSKLGITKSVQYALKKFGIETTNISELKKYIGPPLHKTFEIYNGFDVEKSKKAVSYFREYFAEKGIFENVLFDGIADLLKLLKQSNKSIVLATSKPIYFAEKILNHFEIDHFFDYKVGSNLDGSMTDKTEIIASILRYYNNISKQNFVMVGDREHDIIGAQNNGIDAIGVLYGYGAKDEIKNSNPTLIAQNIEILRTILLNE